jgi:spore coat polysaccharide biosynthesis protein SpsF
MGQPMLQVLIERICTSRTIDELVVATTTKPEDDEIEELSEQLNVSCFRGSELDVLDRVYRAACQHNADIVVRVTGDNPLVDGMFIDGVIEWFQANAAKPDYVTTTGGGYPLGLSVEVFTFSVLKTAWTEDNNSAWREHVTPYIYKNPGRFSVAVFRALEDLSHFRWTVDTTADLAFVRALFGKLDNLNSGWLEAVSIIRSNPELSAINNGQTQFKV